MESAEEILVVILSSALAVFLVLGITLTIALIKLTHTIQRITERAESVVDNVDAAAHTFKNAAGPLAAGKFLVNIAEMVFNKGKGKGKG